MKSITLMLMLMITSSVIAQDNDSGSIEIVEVFQAETPEELEAALTDGYPMPWLEEILSDTTIPEEDRYWLDCRMRAAIARDLHTFFDRDGNPVHIECDYMHPGEDYWREHFIVNPSGESIQYDSDDRPANLPYAEYLASPGYILNLYGEKVGDIAITRDRVWLSRDASVGIFRTGNSDGGFCYDHACFLYPDGSFREQEIDGVFVQYILSQDGNVAVFYSREPYSDDSQERMLYAFDHDGNLIFQKLMPIGPLSGSALPAISPDNRYIGAPLNSEEVWLLDATTGETLYTWGGGGLDNRENWVYGTYLSFSPDSRYLFGSESTVLDCQTGEILVRASIDDRDVETPEGTLIKRRSYCSVSVGAALICSTYMEYVRTNNGQPYVFHTWCEIRNRSGELIYNEPCEWHPNISPNGCILVGEYYNSRYFGGEGTDASSTPLEVMLIEEVQ